MKSEIQEMMIDNNVEDEIVDEWVNITNEKMKRYQELVGRLKGCLEDLREKKEARREVQKKNGRRVENRRNEAGDEKEE